MYHLLKLEGLEVGEYTLKLNTCVGQENCIYITVHKGEYWEGNFIAKNNCIMQSTA